MRRVSLIIGCLLLAAVWLGPLPGWAPHAFWAHMTMHMGVVAVAAPLVALGLAGGRWDPVPHAPRLFAPVPVSVVELVVVWAWHAPGLHGFARHTAGGLVLEQASFFVVGLALWLAAFGGARPRDGRRAGAGVVGLLLTAMHMTFLGALLALTPRPLYAHTAGGGPSLLGGLSPLDDQHLGGAIMVLVGGVAYLVGGVALTATLLRARRAAPAEEGA